MAETSSHFIRKVVEPENKMTEEIVKQKLDEARKAKALYNSKKEKREIAEHSIPLWKIKQNEARAALSRLKKRMLKEGNSEKDISDLINSYRRGIDSVNDYVDIKEEK
jgi:DNA polymerase III delta prime subunit